MQPISTLKINHFALTERNGLDSGNAGQRQPHTIVGTAGSLSMHLTREAYRLVAAAAPDKSFLTSARVRSCATLLLISTIHHLVAVVSSAAQCDRFFRAQKTVSRLLWCRPAPDLSFYLLPVRPSGAARCPCTWVRRDCDWLFFSSCFLWMDHIVTPVCRLCVLCRLF